MWKCSIINSSLTLPAEVNRNLEDFTFIVTRADIFLNSKKLIKSWLSCIFIIDTRLNSNLKSIMYIFKFFIITPHPYNYWNRSMKACNLFSFWRTSRMANIQRENIYTLSSRLTNQDPWQVLGKSITFTLVHIVILTPS